MKCTKTISMLLLGAMLLTLASCGGEAAAEETTAAETTAADTATEAETTAAPVEERLFYTTTDEEIEKLALDGYEFNIFTRMTGSKWTVIDIAAEESSGDVLNDAVYARQNALADRFGFTMKVTPAGTQHADELSTLVKADDDTYDAAFPSGSKATSFAMEGILVNLYTLDYFDADTPYWSRQYTDEVEWGGKLFFGVGSISINAFRSTRAFLFNKSLHADLKLDNLYETVRAGKWTMDVMNTMAQQGAKDLNGDGTRTPMDDQWGMAWQSAISGAVFFFGADAKMTAKDSSGVPVFTLGDERSTEVFDKISQTLSDKNTYYTGADADVLNIFKAGHSLFYTEVLYTMETLRDSDVDFGIIPIPKYDEAQSSYISYVDEWCASPAVVPKSAKDLNRSGFFIQLMAETGDEYIRSPYYDVLLSARYARDPDSVEMLDCIVNNISVDNMILYGWQKVPVNMRHVWLNGTSLATFVATCKSAVDADIQKTNEKYQGN